MTDQIEEPEADEHGIDIVVLIKHGEVFEVQYRGELTRAKVRDYDVQFPAVAHSVAKDADGEFYLETIV